MFSDELRPSTSQDLRKLDDPVDLLPTPHPNSVLPYDHPPEDYEDYVYEEYENEVKNEPKLTKISHNPLTESSTTMASNRALVTSKDRPQFTDRPQFVEHPQNSFIVRGQPAILRCKVIHADKAYFSCNGEAMAASELHKEIDKVEVSEENEDMVPFNVKTLTLQLNRVHIEEFFGLYTCRCDAWSAKGMTSSKNATVEVACK